MNTRQWGERAAPRLTDCRRYLFNGVQRYTYGDEGHEDNGGSVVVVLFERPQDHTEELEDVERVEDLDEGKENGIHRLETRLLEDKM